MANWQKINSTTQRGERIVSSYNNSSATQLWHVYGTYSSAKARAYQDCVDLCNSVNGYDLRITGACSNFFSVGFIFVKDGIKCLAYITHCGDYYVPLEEAKPSDALNDEEWFKDFEKRYNALDPVTKEHLAKACPHITSREQAEGIMQLSEVFNILFKLEKGTN